MKRLIEEAIRASLRRLADSSAATAGSAATVAGHAEFDPESVNFTVSPPARPEHGDFSTNAAMLAAGQLGIGDRRGLAEVLAAGLSFPAGAIAKIEIAGPGFINFRVDDRWYQNLVAEIVEADEQYGRLTVGDGRRVNVEFVSANPTGPLTVGHGRNAVLGDVVARLYEWAGYTVEREYYFNNAGRQMRMLGESVRERYKELLGLPWSLPEGGYEGGYIVDIAEAVRAEHGDGAADGPEELFRSAAEAAIFADIRTTLERLGIHYDTYFNEYTLYQNGGIDTVVDALRAKDLAYDKDGAVWLRGGPLGLEKDPVLVKSSGEPTYRLPDMAYHRDKIRRGYDRIIDVFGADHIDTCQEVLAVVRALGDSTDHIKVVLYQFVTLSRGGVQVKMSTRKANFETLDALLDEVGPDAVRYFFSMRSPNSHMDFDLELAAKQASDNPMYYVQYGYARICSILRKDEASELATAPLHLGLLQHEAERALISALARLRDTLARALAEHEPHRLTTYAAEVATTFHMFYDRCPILGAEDRAVGRARLELARAAYIVLRNVLTMLGVAAPERM